MHTTKTMNTTTTKSRKTPRTMGAGLLAAGLLTALAACGSTAGSDSADHSGHGSSAAAGQDAGGTAAGPVQLSQGWVKTAKKGAMTAVFGTLHNASEQAVTVTGAATDAAGMTQLHETVNDSSGSSKMQEKKGGFELPAGGDYTLKPGGDHIMLMKLKREIKAGEQITLTLTTSAGDEKISVVAKDYTGAKEAYDMGSSHSGTSGH